MSKSELQRLKERLADLTPAKGSRHSRSAVETERGMTREHGDPGRHLIERETAAPKP